MGKIIKYILWIIVALIILAAIAIGILIYTVNPNTLKGPITQQVESITGRTLTINGNITWKFIPWLGISVHKVQLSNASGFDQEHPFLSLKDTNIEVKLFPLLRGIIEFGKINLNGLDLNLATNSQGINNWSDLLKNTHTQSSKEVMNQSSVAKSNEKSQLNIKPLDLTISSINISNANVNYENQKTKQKYKLTDFNLNSQNINLKKSFPINMNFSFSSTQPNAYGQISLNTVIAINQPQQTITIAPFVVNATINGENLPKDGIPISLRSNIMLDQKQAILNLNKIAGQIANLQFSGKIYGVNIFKNPIYNGNVNITKFNPNQFLENLGISLPKFESTNAFSKLAINSDFIITPAAISINSLKLILDQSTLTGHAYLAMSNKNQSNFNLMLDRINIANYLLKKNKALTGTNTSVSSSSTSVSQSTSLHETKPTVSTTQLIPTKLFRQLNLTGKLIINQLTFNKLHATNINLNFSANNGIIQMLNNRADLYQGLWLSNMALNVQTPTPIIEINDAINHVQIEPLLNAFYNSKKLQITGTANLKSNITTQGNNSEQLTQNLNGKGQFSLINGVIKGIPPSPTNNETPFGSLTGTIQIQHGLIKNNDLLLNSNTMQVTGKGYVNLVTQNLRYELAAAVNKNGVAPQIYTLQQKIGGTIPLVIAGNFSDYKIYPNIDTILKNLAINYLRKNTNQISKEVNNGVKNFGNQLQKTLKNLFH